MRVIRANKVYSNGNRRAASLAVAGDRASYQNGEAAGRSCQRSRACGLIITATGHVEIAVFYSFAGSPLLIHLFGWRRGRVEMSFINASDVLQFIKGAKWMYDNGYVASNRAGMCLSGEKS